MQRVAQSRQRAQARAVVFEPCKRGQRALEVEHRLLVRQQSQRALARLAAVARGLGRIAELRGFEEVVRERGQPLVAAGLRELERGSDRAVQRDALHRRQLVVERLAHQRMREREPAQRAGQLAHQTQPKRRGE